MPTTLTSTPLKRTGKIYLERFADDPVAQRALLACAAALRLDDESATDAIEMIAQANGRTRELLHEVKNLGCVWRQWDGTWYLAEDVRKELVEELYRQVPQAQITKLRSRLAEKADQRAATLLPDGQITAHRLRAALVEAGFQRIFVPDRVEEGGVQLGQVWENASPSAGEATARSLDYLAPEIEERVGQLPVQVLFLRGMAARARHDRADQEKYFRAVWERGTNGRIFGVAAHFFGNLVKNKTTAERALNDSLRWHQVPTHRGHVLHSLGNLLASDLRRRRDAESAYRESLKLLHDAPSKAQVWHSLGNLLAKDRGRLQEAENAFKKSLDFDPLESGKAQVWHSLGNLLAKDRRRLQEAESAIRRSIELNPEPFSAAQAYHSLGNLFTKDSTRWRDAEDAFNTSLELWHDRESEAHVGASLANLLSKYHEVEADDRAEQLVLRSLEIDRGNPWTNGVCYRVLADVYERRGDYQKAIKAVESLIENDRKLGDTKYMQRRQDQLARLRQSLAHGRPDARNSGQGETS